MKKIWLLFLILFGNSNLFGLAENLPDTSYLMHTPEYKKLASHLQILLNKGMTSDQIIDMLIEEKDSIDPVVGAWVSVGVVALVVTVIAAIGIYDCRKRIREGRPVCCCQV